MSAAKRADAKQTPSVIHVWLKKLAGLLLGRGRPATWAVLIAAMLLAGWFVVWTRVRDRVLSSRQYVLSPEDLELTPLPAWIHSDIRVEIYRSASIDGPLSIMDDHLTQRIADACSLHPWIAKVRQVSKHHPARVKVDLDYRRPVCMVDVPGGAYAVDAEGAWLPSSSDFSPVEASRYPRLVGIDTMPVGSVGTRWGDARVVGGAEIAAALGPAWAKLQLQRIVPSATPGSGGPEQYTYELLTRGGTRILWGGAPGAPIPGEPSAAEKVARLQQYATEHGSLEGPHGPQQLDVRNPQSLQVSPRTSGTSPDRR